MSRSLFAIYLVEDSEGFVTVKTDHVGQGNNSYELGLALLAHLRMAETVAPESIRVQHLFHSDQLQ